MSRCTSKVFTVLTCHLSSFLQILFPRHEHAHDIDEIALALGGFLGALELPHRENIERCCRL